MNKSKDVTKLGSLERVLAQLVASIHISNSQS